VATESLIIELDAQTGRADAALKNTTESVNRLDNSVDNLDKSINNASSGLDSAGNAISSAGSKVNELDSSVKKLDGSIDSLNSEAIESASSLDKAKSSAENLNREINTLSSTTDKYKSSADKASQSANGASGELSDLNDETSKLNSSLNSLSSSNAQESLNDINSSSKNLKSSISELDDSIDNLQSETTKASSKINKTKADFDNLDKSVNKVNKSTNQLNASQQKITPVAQGVSTALGGIGAKAGQAGIQVQQFVGQIQGGQSAMLALSQQGADLGFVLGAPLLGAIVGIGASLVGMAMSMDSANKKIEEFSFNVSEATEDLQDLTKAQVVVALRETEAAMDSLSNQAVESGNNIFRLSEMLNQGEKESVRFTKTGTAVIEMVKLTDEEIKELTKDLEDEKAKLDTINEEYKKTSDLLVTLTTNTSGYKNANQEQSDSLDNLSTSLERQIIALEQGEEAAFRFSTAQQLGLQVGEQIPENIDQQITKYFELIETLKVLEEQRKQELQDEQQLNSLVERLKTEEERLSERFERERELIGENDELKLALEQEYQDNLQKIKDDAAKKEISIADKKAKTEQSIERQNVSSLMKITSALVGHNDSIGKILFVSSQALAASEVFFNTQVAAMRALAELGPIAGPPVAAAIETSGQLSIAAIAAQTFGSLSGGSSSGAGGVGGTSTTAQNQEEEFTQQAGPLLDVTEQQTDGSVQTIRIQLESDDGTALVDKLAEMTSERMAQGRI
jgi:phage-related tail protein